MLTAYIKKERSSLPPAQKSWVYFHKVRWVQEQLKKVVGSVLSSHGDVGAQKEGWQWQIKILDRLRVFFGKYGANNKTPKCFMFERI